LLLQSKVCFLGRNRNTWLILTSSTGFFTSGVMPPAISELAAVSRDVDGIGCERDANLKVCATAHRFSDAYVYGALNLAYGIGTTSK
jgi:hypothetical protein